jgi:alkylhydroperoxidase family enzyme
MRPHGALFQYHALFVSHVRAFLDAQRSLPVKNQMFSEKELADLTIAIGLMNAFNPNG